MTSSTSPQRNAQDMHKPPRIASSITVCRVVVMETCVSTLINAFIPAGIIWLVGVAPPGSLVGRDGILPGVVAGTVLPIFLMTVFLTRVLRRRISSGRLTTAFGAPQKPAFATLAVPLLPRALALTLLGLIFLAPAAVGLVYEQGWFPMTLYRFTLFNVSYGALTGIVVTPLIVLAALAERHVKSVRLQQ